MRKVTQGIGTAILIYLLWYYVIYHFVPSTTLVGTGFTLTIGILWWRSRRQPVPPAEAEEIAGRIAIDRRVPVGGDIRR